MNENLSNNECSMDYQALSCDFLKAIRVQKSQRELSKDLGYSFNQVGKWESGVTQVKWDNFVHIAKIMDIDLENKIRHFFGNLSGDLEILDIADFLTNYFALHSIESDKTKKMLRRWKKRESSPDLTDFLMMVDSRPSMLIGWLSQFIDCSKIDMIKEQHKEFSDKLDLIVDDPNVVYVTEALNVTEYKNLEAHDDDVLSKHAACTIEDLRITLHRLLDAGIVFFDGRKYLIGFVDFSFSSLVNQKIRKFHKYTYRKVADMFQEDPTRVDRSSAVNAAMASTRVVAISKESAKKVDRLIYKLHNEVAEIVKNDSGSTDNVQIISIASFPSCMSEKR